MEVSAATNGARWIHAFHSALLLAFHYWYDFKDTMLLSGIHTVII